MQILISAFLAILAFMAREILRHRSIAQSIAQECMGSIAENDKSIEDVATKNFLENVATDRTYVPYLILQAPPQHLYRSAIDECYLFGGQALTNLVKTYKLEQSVHQLAADFHSDFYANIPTDRRLKYAKRFFEDLKALNIELKKLQSSLRFWSGSGILFVLALMAFLALAAIGLLVQFPEGLLQPGLVCIDVDVQLPRLVWPSIL